VLFSTCVINSINYLLWQKYLLSKRCPYHFQFDSRTSQIYFIEFPRDLQQQGKLACRQHWCWRMIWNGPVMYLHFYGKPEIFYSSCFYQPASCWLFQVSEMLSFLYSQNVINIWAECFHHITTNNIRGVTPSPLYQSWPIWKVFVNCMTTLWRGLADVRTLPTHDSTTLNKRTHIFATFVIRSSEVRVADTISSDLEPTVIGLFLMSFQKFLQITYHILLIQL
jgi:hypothetical protein